MAIPDNSLLLCEGCGAPTIRSKVIREPGEVPGCADVEVLGQGGQWRTPEPHTPYATLKCTCGEEVFWQLLRHYKRNGGASWVSHYKVPAGRSID